MKKMLVILLAMFSMGFAISAFASPWTVNYQLVNDTNQYLPIWSYHGTSRNTVAKDNNTGLYGAAPWGTYSSTYTLDGDTGIGFGDFENIAEQSENGSEPFVYEAVCSVVGVAGLQWGLYQQTTHPGRVYPLIHSSTTDNYGGLKDISANQDTQLTGTTYTLDSQQYPFSLLAHWNSDHNETVTVTIG